MAIYLGYRVLIVLSIYSPLVAMELTEIWSCLILCRILVLLDRSQRKKSNMCKMNLSKTRSCFIFWQSSSDLSASQAKHLGTVVYWTASGRNTQQNEASCMCIRSSLDRQRCTYSCIFTYLFQIVVSRSQWNLHFPASNDGSLTFC